MNTNKKSKLRPIDDAEMMLDRTLDMFNKLDVEDQGSYKEINMALQMTDRITKICDTKIRFELLRQKSNTIEVAAHTRTIHK